MADCSDDHGMAFALVELPPPHPCRRPARASGARHSDLAYFILEVVDARGRAFLGSVLGSVLGWRYSPGHAPDGWQVDDVVAMAGMIGGAPRATVVPMYRVDDLGAAVQRVRALDGTATDPERQPYGTTSSRTDGQGTRFYLGEL